VEKMEPERSIILPGSSSFVKIKASDIIKLA